MRVSTEQPALPRVQVEKHELRRGAVSVQMGQVLLVGTAKPQLQLRMVAPLAPVQLRSRVSLEQVFGHGVENVEQRFQLELLEVRVLQWGRRGHHVTGGKSKLRLGLRRGLLGPRARKGRVQAFRAVQVEA